MNSSVVVGLSSSGLLTLEYAHGPPGVCGKCSGRSRSGVGPCRGAPPGTAEASKRVCVCVWGGCLLDIPWYFQIFWKERIAYFDRHGVASCWNKVAVDEARRLGHGTSPAWILSLEWGSRGIPGKLYKAFAPWGLVGMGWGEAV